MEEAARLRKEKLAALRKQKTFAATEHAVTAGTRQPSTEEEQAGDASLKRPRSPDQHTFVFTSFLRTEHAHRTVESQASHIQKELKEQVEQLRSVEVDLFTLAPKKPDWDLKRDLEQKLAKLERRTQSKIADLIRMRLQAEKGFSEAAAMRMEMDSDE